MNATQSDVRGHAAPDVWLRVIHVLAVLLLPALAVVLYWPALDGPLIFDDYNTVYYNVGIISLRPLTQFLRAARPLTELSLAVNVALGGFTTRGFHVTNLALHALTGLLVYALVFRTLGYLAGRFAARREQAFVALVAAALFVAHPLQTEVVAYISSRSEGLAGFFYLLAVLVFTVAATSGRAWARRASAVALPFLVAAAVASKEIAVTIPAALLLYDWFFLAPRRQPRARLHWGLVALAAAPLLVGIPVLLSGVLHRGGEVTAGFGFDRFSPWQYLGTQFGVVLHYLRLIVAPVGQCLDYDWPVARSPWGLGVLVPLAALLALVIVAVRGGRRWPLFAFAVLWMLFVLAPTSSIMPIADLVAERRMYVAVVGPLLFLAAVLWAATDIVRSRFNVPRWAQAVAYGLVAACAVGALASLTLARTRLWGDPIALYQDGVDKAPGNPRAWLNLGATNVAQGRFDAALPQLQEAERLYARGESVQAFERVGAYIYYNLGVIAYQQRRFPEAQVYLTKSRVLGPKYMGLLPMTSLYLGHLAMVARDWQTAIERFQEVLKYGNVDAQGLVLPYLARAYLRSGQYEQARGWLTFLLKADPHNAQALRMMQELPPQP